MVPGRQQCAVHQAGSREFAPRYFRGVGHPGEVLIPGSEETAIKGITNTRQSLKEFRDPVVKQPMIV